MPLGKSRKADVQVSHLSLVGLKREEVKSARPHTAGTRFERSVKLKKRRKRKTQDEQRNVNALGIRNAKTTVRRIEYRITSETTTIGVAA
jgi:hypothetical protein